MTEKDQTYFINNRGRNATSSLNNLINQVSFGNYLRVISVYVYVGIIDFLYSNYGSVISNRTLTKYCDSVKQYVDIYSVEQELLSKNIKSGFEKMVKRYITTTNLYDPKSFLVEDLKESGIDFDLHFLGSRDSIEYSIMGLHKLNHYDSISNIDTLVQQVKKNDEITRKQLPQMFSLFFSNKVYKKTSYYEPDSFWWRKMEWDYYQKSIGKTYS